MTRVIDKTLKSVKRSKEFRNLLREDTWGCNGARQQGTGLLFMEGLEIRLWAARIQALAFR